MMDKQYTEKDLRCMVWRMLAFAPLVVGVQILAIGMRAAAGDGGGAASIAMSLGFMCTSIGWAIGRQRRP